MQNIADPTYDSDDPFGLDAPPSEVAPELPDNYEGPVFDDDFSFMDNPIFRNPEESPAGSTIDNSKSDDTIKPTTISKIVPPESIKGDKRATDIIKNVKGKEWNKAFGSPTKRNWKSYRDRQHRSE